MVWQVTIQSYELSVFCLEMHFTYKDIFIWINSWIGRLGSGHETSCQWLVHWKYVNVVKKKAVFVMRILLDRLALSLFWSCIENSRSTQYEPKQTDIFYCVDWCNQNTTAVWYALLSLALLLLAQTPDFSSSELRVGLFSNLHCCLCKYYCIRWNNNQV